MGKNGYEPSILGGDFRCAICHRMDRPLQRHEVFHGPFRQKSKRMGLWISICDECHRAVHQKDGKLDRELKEWAQHNAMIVYGWTVADFRREFGKNYLGG